MRTGGCHAETFMTEISLVRELEERKDADGLILCLEHAVILHKSAETTPVPKPVILPHDIIPVIDALGRLKSSKAIPYLGKMGMVSDKRVHISILKALSNIKDPGSGEIAASHLKDSDPDIRLKALEILCSFKEKRYAREIRALLFDPEPSVRWKAVHAAGEINDIESINQLSILLTDEDESVRNSAETVLEKMGVEKARIRQWKEKANQVSLDDVYKTKIAYQKVVDEKKELQQRLDDQEEVKRKLEEALSEHEDRLRQKEELVGSLYEKERRLIDKLNQLEISASRSRQYQDKLGTLNEKVAFLNRELEKAKAGEGREGLRHELEKTLSEKGRLERESEVSKEKEKGMKEDIARLRNLTQMTRIEAENAQKEVAQMRNRENFLKNEVDNLRRQLNLGMEPMILISSPRGVYAFKGPPLCCTSLWSMTRASKT